MLSSASSECGGMSVTERGHKLGVPVLLLGSFRLLRYVEETLLIGCHLARTAESLEERLLARLALSWWRRFLHQHIHLLGATKARMKGE